MPTDSPMQLGMIGLGRMGANLSRRLMRDGHRVVAYDRNPDVVKSLAGEAPRQVAPWLRAEAKQHGVQLEPAAVTRLLEAYRLNVAVARLMELVSATRKAIDSGPGAADPAVREAAEVLTVLVSLFAPYTAEETWQLLGHKPSVARATWPAVDQALLTQEKVTCVVQVNGKVRDKLEVSPQIGEDELRELALVAPGVVRALGDQQVSRVIVRAPKLVSVVAA